MLGDQLRDPERAAGLAARALSRFSRILWIQRVDARSLSDHDLKQYIQQSYAMILAALPKKTQEALRVRI